SPYAVAKLAAHHLVSIYREGYGMFACAGILFNHESPRRGEEFVTRKITKAVAAIAAGKQDSLQLGNLQAKRDWGYAAEYVEAMWLMLQQDEPVDYVIATGVTHSVQEFAELAFQSAGLDHRQYITYDSSLTRPREPNVLQGDPAKAKEKLDWTPATTFEELVDIMVRHDVDQINAEHPDGTTAKST
ncbi:MAG: GDP-mannose 4,6-dehydratase, partial [Phycisphaerae bacterium]